MYVCIYRCVCIYVNIYMYIHTYVNLSSYMFVCVCVCVCISMYSFLIWFHSKAPKKFLTKIELVNIYLVSYK